MPAFEYTALDRQGRQKHGVIEGDSPKSARQYLRGNGLAPLEITPVAEKKEKQKFSWSLGGSMSSTDLALFTRQLATLVRSGTPLEEALGTTAKQSEKNRVSKTIMGVRSRITEGYSFEKALAAFPGSFPELYRATVAAGEKSGHLDPVLERLADYTESRQEMQQNAILALVYPVILLVIAILVTMGLMTYIVPKVVEVFVDIGQELPLLTRIVMSASAFLQSYWYYLAGLILIAILAFQQLMKKQGFKRAVHRLLLRLPIAGKVIRGSNTARFARTLSILTHSSVPVLDAMRIASEVMTNIPMREAVVEAASNVREGSSISSSLDNAGIFPPMMLHMIASGEASGDLENMLDRAATQQERELKTIIGTTLGLFEPLVIVFMGGFVLVIVLSILLPIINLNQLVN